MPKPTPGQLCYEAYCLIIFGERPDLSHDYDGLAERTQRAWEAAAQAMLAQCTPPKENADG
jgi:hypothetical protein